MHSGTLFDKANVNFKGLAFDGRDQEDLQEISQLLLDSYRPSRDRPYGPNVVRVPITDGLRSQAV